MIVVFAGKLFQEVTERHLERDHANEGEATQQTKWRFSCSLDNRVNTVHFSCFVANDDPLIYNSC